MLKISVSTTALTYVKETLYAPADLDTAPVKGTEIPVMTSMNVRSLELAPRFARIPKEVMNVSVQKDLDLLGINMECNVQLMVTRLSYSCLTVSVFENIIYHLSNILTILKMKSVSKQWTMIGIQRE